MIFAKVPDKVMIIEGGKKSILKTNQSLNMNLKNVIQLLCL
jgi:hypothetical protein